MSGLTNAHGGICQLCNSHSQLLTSYGYRELCPICWQDQLQEHEPERLATLLEFTRHKITKIANVRPR